jgi:hypothetical protein
MESRHEDKAYLLWEAYKHRLGTSEFPHIFFYLHNLLIETKNWKWLEELFSKEEIDASYKNFPLTNL